MVVTSRDWAQRHSFIESCVSDLVAVTLFASKSKRIVFNVALKFDVRNGTPVAVQRASKQNNYIITWNAASDNKADRLYPRNDIVTGVDVFINKSTCIICLFFHQQYQRVNV